MVGYYCPGILGACSNPGQKRYAGFCGHCWLRLSEADRRTAMGPDAGPPAPVHEHHHHVTKIYPRRSALWAVAAGVLSGAAGAGGGAR